ncbi:MAG TPA: hypothetical protein DEP61_03180 [Lachnospiraceae bacterium]|nr:hypothetical protein [Lachnospiraceae bacterium]
MERLERGATSTPIISHVYQMSKKINNFFRAVYPYVFAVFVVLHGMKNGFNTLGIAVLAMTALLLISDIVTLFRRREK